MLVWKSWVRTSEIVDELIPSIYCLPRENMIHCLLIGFTIKPRDPCNVCLRHRISSANPKGKVKEEPGENEKQLSGEEPPIKE